MGLGQKKINLLREFVDFKCEECHKSEEKVGKLEPHRIRPGNMGGNYNHRNIKMLCKKCHELFSLAQRIAEGIQGG